MNYSSRIIASVCLPDMFTSEVCIYRSEEYYRGFITEGRSENGASVLLDDRSLAAEWFTGERLYYGQVT
ncbi:DUF3916 domain-containing protein [Kosakonia cowanii]|uniref:DUF3916 domain-containing protein n=1 Tax=Kosakonia TaxID=1330547 RepID=UPI0039A5BD3F